jgi:putative transposase
MSDYRRAHTPGGTYFFTVVTHRRQPLPAHPESRRLLRGIIEDVRRQHPFVIDAWVLLPDHLHCLWTLPEGDSDYSRRWGMIKGGFTREARAIFERAEWLGESRSKHRESTIWQRRFWEHRIRDDDDYRRHIDYIHWNPAIHGYVGRVADWPFSTFHRYVKAGLYPENWGGDPALDRDGATFGE